MEDEALASLLHLGKEDLTMIMINMYKNCSTGSAGQFSGLSNDQPVGLSFREFSLSIQDGVVGGGGGL